MMRSMLGYKHFFFIFISKLIIKSNWYVRCSNSSSTAETECRNDVSGFRRALPQFFVVGAKNLFALGWGLMIGYPTILIPALQMKTANDLPEFILTEEQISWIGSINLLFVPMGSIISGFIVDLTGKRRLMQIVSIPMLVAWGLFYFATSIGQIYAGLCLCGISGGLLVASMLTYIPEMVEPKYRGMFSASGTLSTIFGVCLQFILGSFLHWKTVAAISTVIPLLSFIAMFLMPETPYWLYAKGRVEQAHQSLQWLRGQVPFAKVKSEFDQIVYAVEEDRAQKKALAHTHSDCGRITPFTKSSFISPLLLIISTFFFGHFSGMTTLQTYAIQIFASFNVSINEYYATILLGTVQMLGSILGGILVHLIGKRPLVFASLIGCGISFLATATHSHLSTVNYETQIASNQLINVEMSSSNTSAGVPNNLDKEEWINMITLTRDLVNSNVTANIDPDKISDIWQQNVHLVDASLLDSYDRNIFAEIVRLSTGIVDPVHARIDQEKLMLVVDLGGQLVNPFWYYLYTVPKDKLAEILKSGRTAINPNIISYINVDKLSDLLSICGNVVSRLFRNEVDKRKATDIFDKIDQDIKNWFAMNGTVESPSIALEMNELIELLETSPSRNETNEMITDNNEKENSWLPLVLLLAGSMFAHMGIKMIPWMLIGEVYPVSVRCPAAGISSAIGYLVAFLSTKLFLSMVAAMTLNGTFWFYSCVAFIGCIVLYFTLPETENKTLLENEAYFDRNKRENLRNVSASTCAETREPA